MLLPRDPSLQMAFVAKAPCWSTSNLLSTRAIRPFSAKLLSSNSRAQPALLHGDYSTPNMGHFPFFELHEVPVSPLVPRSHWTAALPSSVLTTPPRLPSPTQFKMKLSNLISTINLEWPSPCCCSRRDTQIGTGVQENCYWFSVFFCETKSLPVPSVPVINPTVHITNLTEGLTLQSYIFT